MWVMLAAQNGLIAAIKKYLNVIKLLEAVEEHEYHYKICN